MKFSVLTIAAVSLLIAGCVPIQEPAAIVPQATGGNLAQGSVEMSYTRIPRMTPAVDWIAAQQTAVSRCSSWGFSGAQAYENDRMACVATNANAQCTSEQVTRVYQCTQ